MFLAVVNNLMDFRGAPQEGAKDILFSSLYWALQTEPQER